MRRLLIGVSLALLLFLTAGPVGLLLALGLALGWLASSSGAARLNRWLAAGWLLYVAVSLVLSVIAFDVLLMLVAMVRAGRV